MTSLINQEKLRFNSGSMYHIPGGTRAKSSEVSTALLQIWRLHQTYLGYFDHCYCWTLWWICSFGTWYPLPPSFIPITRAAHSSLPSFITEATKLKSTLPHYQSARISYMQTGSANEVHSWDSESKKRDRSYLLTVLVLARKVGGSCLQQPGASLYFQTPILWVWKEAVVT